jgi:hypothetical protein
MKPKLPPGKTRGKCPGRILYRVDLGGGYQVAKLVEWRVTSIKRPPRRGESYWGVSPVGKNTLRQQVYLRPVEGKALGKSSSSFPLDEWPERWSASPKAAWLRAVPLLEYAVEREERYLAEAEDDGCEQDLLDEYKVSLRILRTSLTLAKNNAEFV